MPNEDDNAEEKVYGPYPYKRRWRVHLRGGGRTRIRSFASEQAAQRFADAARRVAKGRSVIDAVEAFAAAQVERGLKATTTARTRYSLRQLLDLPRHSLQRLTWLTPRRAGELYEACRARYAGDTQLNALAAGKAWGSWCADQGWLPASPFAEIDGVGRKARGAAKRALRADEARALLQAALAEGGDAGTAVAVALLLGVRATEVVTRSIRDLDDGGRLLWLDGADLKTEASHRTLEVPAVLQPLLRQLAGNRPREAPLWRMEGGARPTRYWLYHHVNRLCRAAGVAELGPHGLRRSQARLATTAGATPQLVAASLGHESPAITALAYVDRSTARDAGNRRAFAVLQGGLGETTQADPVSPAPPQARGSAEDPGFAGANGGTRTPTVLPTGT